MKMLMKIALPKMGELLVMTAVTISPSRREVSPAEQLCRIPILVSTSVPPRDGGVWSRKPPYVFSGQNTSYRRRWASGACRLAHKAGAAPPTLVDATCALCHGSQVSREDIIPKISLPKVSFRLDSV